MDRETTQKMKEKFLNAANHPLVFIITMTLLVTATRKLFATGFKKLGWTGPANFFA